MADVYTPPPDGSYLLGRSFYMPTENGNIWAISFSSSHGTLVTAGVSVIFTLIFMSVWNLVCHIAMAFTGDRSRRRYAALVTIWNSNDSLFAFQQLLSYSWHFLGNQDFWYGFTFCLLAFAVFAGSMVLGIVGPDLLHKGSVAPVRPSNLYYPSTVDRNDGVGVLRRFGEMAPANMRALGSVEAARVTLRSRVTISETILESLENGETIRSYDYKYTLTGFDFGLQHGTGLSLVVTGSCITEYGWYSDNQPQDADIYQLWGLPGQNTEAVVPIDAENIRIAPKASFISHPNAPGQYQQNGNTSFAIIVWSARRTSIKMGSDPWYATETRNSTDQTPFNPNFWMKRARPVLSCWQQDIWKHGSTVSTSAVYGLKDLQGIKVKSPLLEVLQDAFTVPTLVDLGNASGASALRSATTSPNGVINAEVSSIKSDLERLVLASFVKARNVFVDTTMFDNHNPDTNMLIAGTGQPESGAGDFVVSNPNVQTFSLSGLIALFVVLAALWLAQLILKVVLYVKFNIAAAASNSGPPEGAEGGGSPSGQTGTETLAPAGMILFKALSAPQLFRRIYELEETILKKDKENHWKCSSAFPNVKDDTLITMVKMCGGVERCRGHFARDLSTETSNSNAPPNGNKEET